MSLSKWLWSTELSPAVTSVETKLKSEASYLVAAVEAKAETTFETIVADARAVVDGLKARAVALITEAEAKLGEIAVLQKAVDAAKTEAAKATDTANKIAAVIPAAPPVTQ